MSALKSCCLAATRQDPGSDLDLQLWLKQSPSPPCKTEEATYIFEHRQVLPEIPLPWEPPSPVLHLPHLLTRAQPAFGWGCADRSWKIKPDAWVAHAFLPTGNPQPGLCLSHPEQLQLSPQERLPSTHCFHRLVQPSCLGTAPATISRSA